MEESIVVVVGKKIRIGYVLKSADVRTQVSSRYSENSSHTHPIRQNRKKGVRKKKEQESAEAISGLKKSTVIVI